VVNFVLGYSDSSITAVYSGGTWRNNLDTSMLNRELLTAAAKTVDLTELILDITLTDTKDIQVLGICNHNITTSGSYQWQCFSDAGRTVKVYDSGVIIPYNYDKSILHHTTCDTLDTSISNAYWRLIINDTNGDGFIKLGRLFIGQRFTTECNMDYGLKHEIDTSNTIIEKSTVGIESVIQNVRLRGALFTNKHISYAMGEIYYKMQLELGIAESILYEFDPENKANGIHTFLGRNKTINALDYPLYNLNDIGFVLTEVV